MKKETHGKRRLVQETAAQLRELILDSEPGTHIGSLHEVADQLGVGIVTVQQVARILEHEGLLAVKRGPGGGYYGTRPDEETLQRALATYMRVQGADYRDLLKMTTLLDCELFPAAAASDDEQLHRALLELRERMENCDDLDDIIPWEMDFRNTLFRSVSRPIMEMLHKVTLQLFKSPKQPIFSGDYDVTLWKQDRRKILKAIIDQDPELALFEAERSRQLVLTRIEGLG